MFKITGKIKAIMPVTQVTDSFKKREFVITEESSQYPQDIMFQLAQDKVELVDEKNVGDTISVNFNLRGREWTNPTSGEVKYFNTLDAWRIETPSSSNTPPAQPTNNGNNDEEDLAF